MPKFQYPIEMEFNFNYFEFLKTFNIIRSVKRHHSYSFEAVCGKSVAGEGVTQEVPGEVEEGEAGEVAEDLGDLGPVRHEVVREVELGHVARAGPQLQLARGLDVVVDEGEEGRELPRPRLGAAAH